MSPRNDTPVASADAYNTRMERRRWLNRVAVAVLLVAVGTVAVSAQRRGGRGRFFEPVRAPTPETFQGSFNFCRIMFSYANDGDGGNWAVDYPRADVNLSIRLSELTKTRPATTVGCPDTARAPGNPKAHLSFNFETSATVSPGLGW